jgi:hypothetical protein
MLSRILSGGATAATVPAVALILAASPAPAFTLSASSLDQPVLNGGVEKVWWDRWGYWHPNRVVVYGGPRYFYRVGPVRRCWRGPWGGLRCGWW